VNSLSVSPKQNKLDSKKRIKKDFIGSLKLQKQMS
jgi:hypothetical protein